MRLERDIRGGVANAVERFWSEVNSRAPLIEPIDGDNENVLVTFLWKETFSMTT